jgi:acetyltransferase-like isoleucine patch superfamily enzyme/glycosyltransferase involved in cell wall biosynthesis
MRILFYSNWYVKQTVQVANALAVKHQVLLIFPEISAELNAYGGRVEGLNSILAPNVELVTLPHMQYFNAQGVIPVLKARRIIHNWQPDAVHFNESYDFRCLLLMLLCPKTRFVTSVHDPLPHYDEKISLQKFKHWVRDQIRHRSSGLVVHGESLIQKLAEYSHIPIDRIFAVPHGEYRYYTHFDSGTEKVRNGHRNVLFFGRWEEYKGIDVLIDAEPMISERYPNTRIILAGEGRLLLSTLLPRMIHPESFDIRNYAIPDDEVPDLFKESEVVVLPYREATQSGPLHIAGTFSKPTVVSSVGAMPEVVKDGETGLLVSPGDPKELADAVCRLLGDPEFARKMGENAHNQMAETESMEKVAEVQSQVYEKVLEKFKSQRKPSLAMRVLQTIVKKIKRDPNYALDESMRLGDLIAMMGKLGMGLVRGFYHRLFLQNASGMIFIGKGVKLRNRGHIRVGRNFIAEDHCEIQGLTKQGIHIGDNVTVGSFAMVRPSGYYGREIGEGLDIGDRSNIGAYCYLGASGGITIGKEVMMGPRVSLFAENHNFERTDITMRQQGVIRKRVVIEDDCWLASGAIILAGVTVGKGSIIAAGAVVTKDVPPYSIVGGNPARIIRNRKGDPV